MAQGTANEGGVNWHQIALASLVGVFVESILVGYVAATQPPIPPPPLAATPLFVVNAILASVAFPLLYWQNKLGYLVGLLTGLGVLVQIAAVLTGLYERLEPGVTLTGPIGPFLYLALGLGTLVASLFAWRKHNK